MFALLMLAVPASANAVWTSTCGVVCTNAVMSDAGAGTFLAIDVSGGLLTHGQGRGLGRDAERQHARPPSDQPQRRWPSDPQQVPTGDPGFLDETDFNSTAGVETTVPNSGTTEVTAIGGTANDSMLVGGAGTDASTVAATITFDGGTNGFDILDVSNTAAATPRTYGLTANMITGAGGGIIAFDPVSVNEQSITAGSGDDVFNIEDAAPDGIVSPRWPGRGSLRARRRC